MSAAGDHPWEGSLAFSLLSRPVPEDHDGSEGSSRDDWGEGGSQGSQHHGGAGGSPDDSSSWDGGGQGGSQRSDRSGISSVEALELPSPGKMRVSQATDSSKGSAVAQLRVADSPPRLPPPRAAVHPPDGAALGAVASWVKAQIHSNAIPTQQDVSDKALGVKLMRSLLIERDGTWAFSVDLLLVKGAEDRRGHVKDTLKVKEVVDAWVTMLGSGRFQDHVVGVVERDARVPVAAPKAGVAVSHASRLAREAGCFEDYTSDETATLTTCLTFFCGSGREAQASHTSVSSTPGPWDLPGTPR
ncbi:hypothetical protein T484DRAFT_1802580 [Baffinella frigidus]|nr:hypothetical protein T484DRAFT_1802580 [Cryptophyta sp. CCMP2293]